MSNIRTSNTKSCGCRKTKATIKRNTTHNMSYNKTYESWFAMKRRCKDENLVSYKDYGGRGITYDKKWDTFEGFYEDMGDRPKNHTLDRIDVNGNYNKGNCRWAFAVEQANNTRCNRYIEYNGETKTMSQWARYLGMNLQTLSSRLNVYKWSVEKALSTSVNKR